jgi:hypothetical protein
MQVFFHLHECDDLTLDHEGRELPDLTAAKNAAVEAARSLMGAELLEGRLSLECHITVTDSAGVTMLTVPFREVVAISGLPR